MARKRTAPPVPRLDAAVAAALRQLGVQFATRAGAARIEAQPRDADDTARRLARKLRDLLGARPHTVTVSWTVGDELAEIAVQ